MNMRAYFIDFLYLVILICPTMETLGMLKQSSKGKILSTVAQFQTLMESGTEKNLTVHQMDATDFVDLTLGTNFEPI